MVTIDLSAVERCNSALLSSLLLASVELSNASRSAEVAMYSGDSSLTMGELVDLNEKMHETKRAILEIAEKLLQKEH